MKDGRLEIDNNRSERAIKPFVIGRKNWMFSNTSRSAKASATIYSIIETAKENSLNPMVYLTYLFETLPNLADPNDPVALDKLLPWSQTLPLTCRVFKKYRKYSPHLVKDRDYVTLTTFLVRLRPGAAILAILRYLKSYNKI